MPINLKHSGNAAPALAGAFAGGEGERGAKDAPVLAGLYGQRAAQRSQQASQMMSQLKASADQRQAQFLDFARQRMSERQREIDRQGDIARADAIRAENRQNFLDDRAHAEERQDALRAEEVARAEAAAKASEPPSLYEQRNGIFDSITPEQYKAHQDEIDKGITEWYIVGDDDRLTDEERDGLRKDIERRVAERINGPHPPAPATMEERWGRETFVDPDTGARYGVDKSGKWYPIAPAGGPGASPGRPAAPGRPGDYDPLGGGGAFGMPEDVYWKHYDRALKTFDEDDKPPTPEQVHKRIAEMRRAAGYDLSGFRPAPAHPDSPDEPRTGLESVDPATGRLIRHAVPEDPEEREAFIDGRASILSSLPEPGTRERDLLGRLWDSALAAETGAPAPAPEHPEPPAPSGAPAPQPAPESPAPEAPPAPAPQPQPYTRDPATGRLVLPPGVESTPKGLSIDGEVFPAIPPPGPPVIEDARRRRK